MKRVLSLVILMIALFGLGGCINDKKEKEEKNTNTNTTANTNVAGVNGVTPMGKLSGIIHDTQGVPVEGVRVVIGEAATNTNADGSFNFTNVNIGNDATIVIRFNKKNYVPYSGAAHYKDTLGNDIAMDGNSSSSSITTIESDNITLRVPLQNATATLDVEMVELVTLKLKLTSPIGYSITSTTAIKVVPTIKYGTPSARLVAQSEYETQISNDAANVVIKNVPRTELQPGNFNLKVKEAGNEYASYFYNNTAILDLMTKTKIENAEQNIIDLGALILSKYFIIYGSVFKDYTMNPAEKVTVSQGNGPHVLLSKSETNFNAPYLYKEVYANNDGDYMFTEVESYGGYYITIRNFDLDNGTGIGDGRPEYINEEVWDKIVVGQPGASSESSNHGAINRDLFYTYHYDYSITGKIFVGKIETPITDSNIIGGVKVKLYSGNTLVDAVQTDETGNFTFNNVAYANVKVVADAIDTDGDNIANFNSAVKGNIANVGNTITDLSTGKEIDEIELYMTPNNVQYKLYPAKVNYAERTGTDIFNDYVFTNKQLLTTPESIQITFNQKISQASVNDINAKGGVVAKILGKDSTIVVASAVVSGNAIIIDPVVNLDPLQSYTVQVNNMLMSDEGYAYSVKYAAASDYDTYSTIGTNGKIAKAENAVLLSIKPEIVIPGEYKDTYTSSNILFDSNIVAKLYKDIGTASAKYLDDSVQTYSPNALEIKFALDKTLIENISKYEIYVKGPKYGYWVKDGEVDVANITKTDVLVGYKVTTADLTKYVVSPDNLGFGNKILVTVIPRDKNEDGKAAVFPADTDTAKVLQLKDGVAVKVEDMTPDYANTVLLTENVNPDSVTVTPSKFNTNIGAVVKNKRMGTTLDTVKFDLEPTAVFTAAASYNIASVAPGSANYNQLTLNSTNGLYEDMVLNLSGNTDKTITVNKIISGTVIEFNPSFDVISGDKFVIKTVGGANAGLFDRAGEATTAAANQADILQVYEKAYVESMVATPGIYTITIRTGNAADTKNPLLGYSAGSSISFESDSLNPKYTIAITTIKTGVVGEYTFETAVNASTTATLDALNTNFAAGAYYFKVSQATLNDINGFVIGRDVTLSNTIDSGIATILAADTGKDLIRFSASPSTYTEVTLKAVNINTKKVILADRKIKFAVGDLVRFNKDLNTLELPDTDKNILARVEGIIPVSTIGGSYMYEYTFNALSGVVEGDPVEFNPTIEIKIDAQDTSNNGMRANHDEIYYDITNTNGSGAKWTTK